MSGSDGGVGVDLSPAGLLGTGTGPVGAAVAPILPVSPPELEAVEGGVAKAGEAIAKDMAKAVPDRPNCFNMGDSYSRLDAGGASLHLFDLISQA